MKSGKIVTLSGISGSGKSYLKQHVLSKSSLFQPLISVTTRKRRKGEIDGVDKYFFTKEEIEEHINDYSDKSCVNFEKRLLDELRRK